MASGIEVAKAYVTIIPSMKGIQGEISKQLGIESISTNAGKTFGNGLLNGLSGVTGKLSSALGKTISTVTKAATAGTVAAAAAAAAVSKSALDSYAQYEQLAGGAEQIFSQMDFGRISADAQAAYRDMGMSANEYLESINQVGAAFKATMGDERGYDTAKRGMQAISDYASGTGRNLDELNDKYQMITRSTSSYQSIADQFSGILPATSADFLKQAQAAGLLSGEYKKLTEVPIDQYQQAVTGMLERGVDALNLTGNTAREAEHTISGSLAMAKASWTNLLTELGKDDGNIEARVGEVVDSALAVVENAGPRLVKVVGALIQKVPPAIAENAPKVMQAMTELLDGVTDGAFSRAVAKIQPSVERIGGAISGLIDRLAPLAPYAQQIGSAVGDILAKAFEAASKAVEALAPILADIAEAVMPVLADAAQLCADAFEKLVDIVTGALEFLGESFGKIGDFLKDPLGSIQSFGKDIQRSFTNTGKSVTKTASATERSVSKTFTSMATSAQSSGNTMQRGVSGSFTTMQANGSKSVSALESSVRTGMTNAASTTASRMSALEGSVKTSTGNAASSAESTSTRIKNAWNKSYKMTLNSEANTSTAENKLSKLRRNWNGSSITFTSYADTDPAERKLQKLYARWAFTSIPFSATGGAFARGAIIEKHADGFIANRPGRGVDITRHIAGEAGAEAIIPLTNKRYVRPFAETVADLIDVGNDGVTITGNTFIVRNDRDISAIGRAINEEAERVRRSRL